MNALPVPDQPTPKPKGVQYQAPAGGVNRFPGVQLPQARLESLEARVKDLEEILHGLLEEPAKPSRAKR